MEEEVTLKVKDRNFTVKKKILCDHSAYFKAMFSGNFKEQDQKEIPLNSVDATSMELILKYLECDKSDVENDLKKYPLEVIINLAEATNYLHVNFLLEMIEAILEHEEITAENWFALMAVARKANFLKIQEYCAETLPPLVDMDVQHVPSTQAMVWYLSQSQLIVPNEYYVFKFGLEWLFNNEIDAGSSVLLMLLGCIDMAQVTYSDLTKIQVLMKDFEKNLAVEVVNILTELSVNKKITVESITARKTEYSENVYDEVLSIVKNSRQRCRKMPLVPVVNTLSGGYSLYQYTNVGLEEYIVCPNYFRNRACDVVAWGHRLIFAVPAESLISLYIYEIVKKEWLQYQDIKYPCGSTHLKVSICRLAIVGHLLFVFLDSTVIMFDLKNRTQKCISKLPFDCTTSIKLPMYIPKPTLPLLCVHDEEVYASDHMAMYKYVHNHDEWLKIIHYNDSGIMSNIVSHKQYIYVAEILQRVIYRFKPGEDRVLTRLMSLRYDFYPIDPANNKYDTFSTIVNSCSLGDRLLFFTTKTIKWPHHYFVDDSNMLLSKGSTGANENSLSSSKPTSPFLAFPVVWRCEQCGARRTKRILRRITHIPLCDTCCLDSGSSGNIKKMKTFTRMMFEVNEYPEGSYDEDAQLEVLHSMTIKNCDMYPGNVILTFLPGQRPSLDQDVTDYIKKHLEQHIYNN